MDFCRARTSVLDVGYEVSGPTDGVPVLLMHGFPYSVRAYDEVVRILAEAGLRTFVPHLRGYGATQFLDSSTMRSGEQAVLGNDLRELLDALQIERALLCGYDWGGRAACVVAALWPDRCLGLVTGGGYNIQNIAASINPASPEIEHVNWYQYYFNTERGRAGLTNDRRGIARLLWTLWSPTWAFDDITFERSAAALDNPDFVDVVIHSYRHRYGYVQGDLAVSAVEQALAMQPAIAVPTINLVSQASPWPRRDGHDEHDEHVHFTGAYERRLLPGIGHNIPQEAPVDFAAAVIKLTENA
jgi:pimeloyl-ACP methyl ester carboxylesterase